MIHKVILHHERGIKEDLGLQETVENSTPALAGPPLNNQDFFKLDTRSGKIRYHYFNTD